MSAAVLNFDTSKGISFKDTADTCFTLKNGNIFDATGAKLPVQNNSAVLAEILKTEFFIPAEMNITKFTHSGKTPHKLAFKIEAKQGKTVHSVDFSMDKGKVRLEHIVSTDKDNSLSLIEAESFIIDGANKEYFKRKSEQYKPTADFGSIDDEKRSKRNVSSKSIKLEMLNYKGDEITGEFDEHSTVIEISAREITKTTTQNGYDAKSKLKTTYDLQKQTIKSQMRKTEYEAYHKTEYKNTLLTPVFHKKAKVTTPFDHNFNATLDIAADGSSAYQKRETMPNMTEQESSVKNDMSQVAPVMLKDVQDVKDMAAKTAIIKNSQHADDKTDFSRNPSVFDEYAGFTAFKENATEHLAAAFASSYNKENSLHWQLLTELNTLLQNQTSRQLLASLSNGR